MEQKRTVNTADAETDELIPVGRGPSLKGNMLGSYRITSQAGEGGMGVVYRAEHARLGRKVAIKMLRRDLVQRKEIVARFFNEARAVNEIGHPNIVDIIDFVEDYEVNPPLVYMVMELLEGQDLRSRISQAGALDADEAISIGLQVCNALIAVHKVRILHRDLKPDNIFLIKKREIDEEYEQHHGARVKLLDFGVARAFGERERDNITDPGTAIGTPEYMAPEQVLGRELDNRTDIYALGMVLYEMLTGNVPFTSHSFGEILVRAVKERPPPVFEARKQGPPVPKDLEIVVMRCLEKDPQLRFQTVKDLRKVLAAIANKEQVAGKVTTHAPVQSLDSVQTPEDAAAPRVVPASEQRPRRRSKTAIVPGGLPQKRWGYIGPIVILVLSLGAVGAWWVMKRSPATESSPVEAPAAVGPNTTKKPATGPPPSVEKKTATPAQAAEAGLAAREDAGPPPAAKTPRPGKKVATKKKVRPVVKQPIRKKPAPVSKETSKKKDIVHGTMDPFAK